MAVAVLIVVVDDELVVDAAASNSGLTLAVRAAMVSASARKSEYS